VLGPMLLPCGLLDALLFLTALRTFIAPLLLGVLLLVVPVLPLRLLGVLLLQVVTVLLPRLLGVLLLPVVPVLLPLLLSMLLLVVSVLLLLRLLSVLLPLFRFRLLMLTLLLLGMVLFFALLLVLCIGRTSDSEKQRKNGCARNVNYFHRFRRLFRLHSITQR